MFLRNSTKCSDDSKSCVQSPIITIVQMIIGSKRVFSSNNRVCQNSLIVKILASIRYSIFGTKCKQKLNVMIKIIVLVMDEGLSHRTPLKHILVANEGCFFIIKKCRT
ncbi:hypothetical protein ACTA71_009265 [Dictyostelium dimigraforme]